VHHKQTRGRFSLGDHMRRRDFNSGQYSRKNIALSRVGCETAELGNCATGTCRVDDAQSSHWQEIRQRRFFF
jgi:hypothetical protein